MLITDSNACSFWSSFWLITFGFDFIFFPDNFSFHWGISLSHSSQRFNWMFALVGIFLCELPNINHVWMVQCTKWFHERCGIYEFCCCNLLLTHSRLSVKRFLVGVGWNVKSIGPRETITWQIVILFTELHPLYCTGFSSYVIYDLSYLDTDSHSGTTYLCFTSSDIFKWIAALHHWRVFVNFLDKLVNLSKELVDLLQKICYWWTTDSKNCSFFCFGLDNLFLSWQNKVGDLDFSLLIYHSWSHLSQTFHLLIHFLHFF